MNAKTTPRLQLGQYGSTAQLLRPLPPTLATAIAETPEAQAHDVLVRRVEAQTDRLQRLRAATPNVRAEDDEAERAATIDDRKPPAQKLPGHLAKLSKSERRLAHLHDELHASAGALVARAAEHVADAESASTAATERELDAAADLLTAALAALVRASQSASEAGWLAGLDDAPTITPWSASRAGPIAPKTADAIAVAQRALPVERAAREERRDYDARAAEAEAKLPPPPEGPPKFVRVGEPKPEPPTSEQGWD